MKLYIEEKMFSEHDKQSLCECILNEILTDDDIVQELSTYIPNFDKTKSRKSYANYPTVVQIKNEIFTMIKKLETDLNNIDKIKKYSFKKSPHMGLSNYLQVKFKKPENPPVSWSQQYKDLYYMNIKVSDHIKKNLPSVTHTIDLLHKTLTQTRQSIMQTINDQLNLIKQAEEHLKPTNNSDDIEEQYNLKLHIREN